MLNQMRHWLYISTKGQADLRPYIQGHSHWTATYISKHHFPLKSLGCLMEYSVDINMILDRNGHHAHIG